MDKEILLYSSIHDYSAAAMINAIQENRGFPLTIRINSQGGDVFAAWGMKAKIKEHGNVTMQADGAAMSDAANLLFYGKQIKALNVSRILFHRADADNPTAEQKVWLNDINNDMKVQMTAKVDAVKFKAVTGYTIDDLFNPDSRIDIMLTGQQAKDLGLVDELINLTPSAMAEFEAEANNSIFKVAAMAAPNTNSNLNTMKLSELKTSNPTAYAELMAEAKLANKPQAVANEAEVTAEVKAERARVKAWMAWHKADPEMVTKAVAEGREFTIADLSELTAKVMNPEALKKLADESADPIVLDASAAKDDASGTDADGKKKKKDVAAEKELAAFGANAFAHLGYKTDEQKAAEAKAKK